MTTQLKGNWNKTKGKLKQKFALLTHSDILWLEGREDEVLGKLQHKQRKSKVELEKITSELNKILYN